MSSVFLKLVQEMAELLLVAPSSSKFFLNFSPGVPATGPEIPGVADVVTGIAGITGLENWTKKDPASHAETGS